MATGANTYIAADEAVHTSNQIKDLRLRLSETDETVEDSRNRASKHGVHGNALRQDVQLDRHLILSKRHIYEDIADEDEHDAEYRERQRLRVVVEVLCDVHVIQTNQCVEVLLLNLHMS